MMIEEIAEKIIESRNNDIAKAFTLHISSLLLHNGIVPIMTEYTENDAENIEDKDEYKIAMEYGIAFKELDCTEHDKKIYNKAIDDYNKELKEYLRRFTVHYVSDADFDYVAEQLKAGDNNGT